jgi:hypothetical protein
MPHVIRIRDVAREAIYDMGSELRALRVPYEMFNPTGPVRRRGELMDWFEGNAMHSGRFAEAELGDCHPGDRVIVRLPPQASEDEWWLCEVQAIDGVAGTD